MAAEDERQLALTNALAQIERQFGKGSIMRMGDFQERMALRGRVDRLDRARS